MKDRFDFLSDLALTSLPTMRDPASGLFSQKCLPGGIGTRNVGVNPLYSAISAIGLLRAERRSAEAAVAELGSTFDALAQTAQGPQTGSIVGTTLWALCLAEDSRAAALISRLERVLAPEAASTMDLGLALSGVTAAIECLPAQRDRAARIADRVREELLRRFVPQASLFRGSRRLGGPRAILMARLTSFASQAYSIHGLAEYARVIRGPAPQAAVTAAGQLVERQGKHGQWWWFYSLDSGAVLERYPVYSVHQDGMAFMALAALDNLGAGSFAEPLALGLEWVFGGNELGATLVDPKRFLVYRCIQRRGSDPDGFGGMSRANHAVMTLRSFRSAVPSHDCGELEVLRECRSYHLGWLLYARSLLRS